MDQRLFTVDEAADFLQLHPKTLRRKIREGEIQSTRVGKRYRFTQAQLQDYLGEDCELPVRRPVDVARRVTSTVVVDVTAVSPALYQQLSNYLTAALANAREADAETRLTSHCHYFPETAELKIMLSGDIGVLQSLLGMLHSLLEQSA